MLNVVMPNAEWHYAECRYAEYLYAKCRYAERHYAECHYAECRYAECYYAECLGALNYNWLFRTISLCLSVGTHRDWAFYFQVRRENVKEKLQGGGGPGGCIAPVPTWKQKKGHWISLGLFSVLASYSQHSHFLCNLRIGRNARVLQYSKSAWPVRYERSSLLVPF
jgi:hypothetical protein